MDWSDSDEQAAFRVEVRKFIEERLPERYRRKALEDGGFSIIGDEGWAVDRASGDPEAMAAAREWVEALSERGWVAPSWPEEFGGAGMTVWEQHIFSEEMARAAAPAVPGGSGVAFFGPALIIHGSEEQKRRYLPDILSGKTVWCQGYSEPGAGSDLAGLSTRAARDGDEYVINGQKIWTHNAHNSDAIFLLARTDADAPRHRGISLLIIEDMHAQPGLSVRPLINMAWEPGLNETFFQDVRIPSSQIVGEENRGWYVGMTLLDFERSAAGGGAASASRDLRRVIAFATSAAGRRMSRLDSTPTLRAELTERFIEVEVAANFARRITSMADAGMVANYEASMAKAFSSESGQRFWRTVTKIFGLYSNVWDPDSEYAVLRARPIYWYVASIPMSIAGGANEIQRNIIATRGLGLPRG